MATTFLRQRAPDRSAGSREPDRRHEPGEDAGRALVCAACLQAVTTTSARIEMAGGHAHTFSNPHGIVFHIGCFAVAPGCVVASEPSTQHSWFPPYAWQIAVCRGCAGHLGWLFHAGDSRFHGLILDRLTEDEGSGN
jgi:hypothetical protein